MGIKLFEKHKDLLAVAINKKTRLIALEGTVRSSKTVMAIQSFFYRVFDSDSYLHLIAGRDFDSINNNILKNETGLLTQFKKFCELKKGKVGGYYVELKSKKGLKKIILVGYNDKNKWTKILGGSIECIFVDEVNIANKQFIDECFSRQISFENPFTIWTTNGDMPTHWIYTEFINYCKIIGEAPASIRADMESVINKPGWYYMHWKMEDNPIMTPKKIELAKSIYPVGSYYFTIKILGERGIPGNLIFNDYLNAEKIIQNIEIHKFNHFGIGVDIGASRAKNSFVFGGFNVDYSKAGIIDKETFQELGYKEKTERLKKFVYKCLHLGVKIDYIAVDSAEQNYIEDLRAESKRLNLPEVIPSYKATIKQRIDMIILLAVKGKLIFNNTPEGINAFKAYTLAKWAEGKIGEEREDLNEWFNDVMDSVEYLLTRHMKKLLRAGEFNNV